jgi:outer membrane protein assembly factor BamB
MWRVEVGKRLSAGVGADPTLVAVGTDKGDVFAYTPDGKPLWQSKVTSEIVSPPKVSGGIVVVWSGDGGFSVSPAPTERPSGCTSARCPR